jgi:hypothetical protein
MAMYWTDLIDGNSTDHVDSVDKLHFTQRTGNTVYAQGDGIDFEKFFNLSWVRPFKCLIRNSTISQLILKGTSDRTGVDNSIAFENCNIDEVVLSAYKILNLSIAMLTRYGFKKIVHFLNSNFQQNRS